MLEVLKTGKPKADFKNYKNWLGECRYELPWDENEFDIEYINDELIADAQDNYDVFNWKP